MAIGSARVTSISRSGGRSATAAAAYRTGQKITDERTGLIHDYTPKARNGGVVDVAMYLPKGAPEMTTAELWNKAESAENRKNSQLARELLVALPHELNQVQRRELVDAIAGAMVERYGVAAEAAIHQPGAEGDQRNHHVHLMFTTRRMDASGQLTEKTRELDVKPRSSAEVRWIRGMVEDSTNQALQRAGFDERIDMRSQAEQAGAAIAEFDRGPLPLDQHAGALSRFMESLWEPTLHEGPDVTAAKRAAKRRVEPSLSILAQENELRRDSQELAQLDAQIYHFEHFAPLQAAAAAARKQEQEHQEQGRRVAELRRQLSDARHAVDQANAKAAFLRGRLNTEPPPFVAEAQRLKAKAEQTKAEAQQWRAEHPKKAWMADKLDRPLEVDRMAGKAAEQFNTSQERAQALQWQAERGELSAELERIEAQYPTLAKQPGCIEDELLLHYGDGQLRQDIEDRLRVVHGVERSIDAERRDPVRRLRTELVERLEHSPTGTDLVQVYRDAERLLKRAQRLENDCTLARKLEVLDSTKLVLREAHSLIEKSSHRAQPELVEALSVIQEQETQNRKWRGMDTDQWPDLDALQRLQAAASDLFDRTQSRVRRFEQSIVPPGGHMQQSPSGPDKPKRGPRPG